MITLIKEHSGAASAAALLANVGTYLAEIQVALQIVIALLTVVVLAYTVALKRREWKAKKKK